MEDSHLINLCREWPATSAATPLSTANLTLSTMILGVQTRGSIWVVLPHELQAVVVPLAPKFLSPVTIRSMLCHLQCDHRQRTQLEMTSYILGFDSLDHELAEPLLAGPLLPTVEEVDLTRVPQLSSRELRPFSAQIAPFMAVIHRPAHLYVRRLPCPPFDYRQHHPQQRDQPRA